MSCKCHYECREISHEHKLKLFHDFYGMKDYVRQNSYLMGLVSICNIRRRRHGNYEVPENSRRQATVYFTLPDGKGNIVQVCKKTFLEVYGITKRRIETLVKAKKSGDVVYKEKRGNKKKMRKFTENDEELVIEHIQSFPREQSHYSRLKTQKEYLSSDLNMNRLYLAFKEKYPQTEISYRYYYCTFKKKFPSLSFHHPRSDTCGTCDLLTMEMKNNPNNQEAKRKLELHHRKAERAMAEMRRDHENSQLPSSHTCTLSVDLQQVLSLPAMTHCQMYYLRQLSCYNLCVHVGDSNKGLMFLWHEGITGRGGNEIASCILKAVTNNVTYKRHLTVWSDNCAGQNKNKMLLFLWIYLVARGHFDEVNHKYLISGHSFLSCDRDFAQIEKRRRREKCQVPMDLVRLMVTATPKNPFTVALMQKEDFFDFKSAAEATVQTTSLKISKAHWVRISKDNPGKVGIRETLNDVEEWKVTNVFKKNINVHNVKTMELQTLDCTSRISEEKKANLRSTLPYIKEENKSFFQDLLQ